MNNYIKSTVITDKVRVSSAIVYRPYQDYFGGHYQYETIVFGKDEPEVGFQMEIHGNSPLDHNQALIDEAIAYHDKLVQELKLMLFNKTE